MRIFLWFILVDLLYDIACFATTIWCVKACWTVAWLQNYFFLCFLFICWKAQLLLLQQEKKEKNKCRNRGEERSESVPSTEVARLMQFRRRFQDFILIFTLSFCYSLSGWCSCTNSNQKSSLPDSLRKPPLLPGFLVVNCYCTALSLYHIKYVLCCA